jgi:amino acid adenylation domain-containing protein
VLEHASTRPADHPALTPREKDVLSMIARGMTNGEVAARLDVTVHAVKFHLSHIYRKLGVTNRTEAAVAFHRLSALDAESGASNEAPDPAAARMLFEWNATDAPFPDRCLHELVAERAALAPGAVAVIGGADGARLTYGELERRANKLARHLQSLGVGPETLVGIAVSRSPAMVVGLLGILKAGGAYVPIDPTYPQDRVAYMLENAEAPVVVTEDALVDRLPLGGARVVRIDSDWPQIDSGDDTAPASGAGSENLAYVIYTSGSTGNPKGVQIPHRALVNFVTTMGRQPGLSADDALLAVTTLSFDIAGLELYLPLVTGARVVIATQEQTADPQALARLIDEHEVTTMQATPTTWRMLVDSGWRGRAGFKALCGGEALPLALSDALVERELELWNMYGPTETTIWSTTKRIETRGEPLTIGRPIANTTLYVLDEELSPVEVGTPGELHIGGAGLARGYRGRPDLTDERFLPHPFLDEPDARIYKTGDLVRYRADGEVEYIGRLDHQVKVRGFRIELGEIETVLSRHPHVRDAVAVAREDTPGDARIVAYVRQTDGQTAAAELREHAAASLPPYMVPSVVVTLDEYPLTPNGKIDRKALPAPVYERSAAVEYVAPRTKTERKLVKIWQDELGVERIGISDDFFDFGATSIVAARVIAEIQRRLGRGIALTPIFEARTIEQLGKVIDSGSVDQRWTSLVPMQRSGPKEPVFCVHGGAGTILHLEPLARRLADERPFYGLQSQGLYGGAPPILSVEEMAAHYLDEIRTVQPEGPYYLAGYCFGAIVAFEMARRLQQDGEEVASLAMFNGPSPSWIKQWGWFGNQPRHRQAFLAAAPPKRSFREKVERVIEDPSRIVDMVRRRYAWVVRRVTFRLERPRARLSLKFGRPLPEWLRESYFLRLHAWAEKAYTPEPIDGEILVFSGQGLYDDITLGWEGLANGGVKTYVVPGEHRGNRGVMRPGNVELVLDVLRRSWNGTSAQGVDDGAEARIRDAAGASA